MAKPMILSTTKAIFVSNKPLTINELVKNTGLCRRTIERHVKQMLSEGLVKITHSGNHTEYQYYRAI